MWIVRRMRTEKTITDRMVMTRKRGGNKEGETERGQY